jgi:hypothetical protein
MSFADARTAADPEVHAAESERQRAHRAWSNAERIQRLSDGLIRIGPWGLGLDGVLAWVPGANALYSAGAGGLLIYEAVQARCAPKTLARMALYLGLNTAMDSVPVAGWALDTLFRAHAMASRALQKDVERRWGRPADAKTPRRWGWGVRDVAADR